MNIDIHPTTESSCARTLIGRGCPKFLALEVASLLAHTLDAARLSPQEEALIKQAYSYRLEERQS
ncbi:MAG: hypothetical protein HC824_14870 [Synechococcales cyanobacterium RM1_1_8]|nr:hypothetical protein [Synechococcales cyanobacterium RM1_1_8]